MGEISGTLYRLRIGVQHVQTQNVATLPISADPWRKKIIIREANEKNIEIHIPRYLSSKTNDNSRIIISCFSSRNFCNSKHLSLDLFVAELVYTFEI